MGSARDATVYRAKALILAAGLGKRLRPLTLEIPKCLVRVGGKPLLHYWLTSLRDSGVREVLVNTHHLRDQLREFIRGYRVSEFRVIESFEPELLGSAGTISANATFMSDADYCFVIYADNYSDVDLSALLTKHVESGAECSMLLFETPVPSQCGIVELDADNRIVQFEEKPSAPASNLANGGVYVMNAALYEEIAAMNGFDLGYDVLPRLTERIHGFVHHGYHKDIGTVENLNQVNEHLAEAR